MAGEAGGVRAPAPGGAGRGGEALPPNFTRESRSLSDIIGDPKSHGKSHVSPWKQGQKRLYRIIMSEIHLWASYGGQVRKLELTTADGGDASKMQIHFKQLLRAIGKKLGYGNIDYAGVQTIEGNGVLHVFISWIGRKTFFIKQAWLSEEWRRIHGARIVWIRAITGGEHTRTAIRYVAAQYVAGQKGPVRLFRSRRYIKFTRGGVWEGFRAAAGRHLGKSGMADWRAYLSGEAVNLADGTIWQRDDVAEQGPPSSRVPIGPFIGDGERWRVPPGQSPLRSAAKSVA